MNAILESIVTLNLQELPCVFCSHVSGQLFSVPELKKHFDECHVALKLYGCHCCGKGFASRDALAKHSCFLFSQFMVVAMISDIQEANFHREYSSLICSKCGLQIDLKFLSENLDHQQTDHLVRQFQDCLLGHSPQDFILCTVHMFQEANHQDRSLKIVFMFEQSDSISGVTDNEALCMYIQEAFRLQQDPKCSQKTESNQKVSMRSKKVDHNKFYTSCSLLDGATQYSCKLCGFRTEINAPSNFLVEHMADKHLDQLGKMFGSYNIRLFNAQSQFKRIDLGEGNYKYECKVCGHLTKMNIKPSALSQHFKDRHPEVRAQAAFSFASRMLGFSENSGELPTNNHKSNGINQSAGKGFILDKDIEGLNETHDHAQTLLGRNWTKYEANLEITFLPGNISSIKSGHYGLGLLGDDVYSCQMCNYLTVGQISAKEHHDCSHVENPFKPNIFDVYNAEQVLPVFRFTDLPHQGIHCFICGDLSHCSLLSFCKHLAKAHNKQFFYDLNKHVDIFEMASKVRKIICELKVADESELIQTISNDFLENDLRMFDVKQEDALCLFQNNTVEPLNQSHPVVKISEMFGSTDFSAFENSDDFSQNQIPSTSTPILYNSVEPHATSFASAVKTRRSELLKNKKYKSCRFNAQEYFQVIVCETDPLSRRYECIVCGHVTKPNVSPNTLSQHFGDKHPEMRAQANNAFMAANVAFKPRSKRIKSRAFKKNIVSVIPRIKESPGLRNPTNSNPCANPVSVPLADDIVFGSFLNDNSLDEFDRLARSSTVFPYFEIVIKTDAEISLKLLNSLSNLFAKTVNNKEKQQQITDFAGELLKRSRANNINPIKDIPQLLVNKKMNVEGIFAILDNLLCKSGKSSNVVLISSGLESKIGSIRQVGAVLPCSSLKS